MLRVDLHLHTAFSGDSSISPRLLVNQLHSHPSIKAVAITDHNTLKGYFHVQKLASIYEDLTILPGVEVSTEEGDLIILGVEETPKIPTTSSSAVDFAKACGAVIIIPHPYRSMGIGDLAMKLEADAVEVLNPTATKRENAMAYDLARIRNLPGVAGTDAHNPTEMWTVYTEIKAQPSIEDILKAIRKGFVKPVATKRATLAEMRGG